MSVSVISETSEVALIIWMKRLMKVGLITSRA